MRTCTHPNTHVHASTHAHTLSHHIAAMDLLVREVYVHARTRRRTNSYFDSVSDFHFFFDQSLYLSYVRLERANLNPKPKPKP